MALNATAIDLLTTRSGFDSQVALGIAQAIEVSMTQAQWVTVPVLEARLQELKASTERGFAMVDLRFAEMNGRIDGRVAEMNGSSDKRFAEMTSSIDKRFAEMTGSIDRRFVEMDRSLDARFAGVEGQFAGIKAGFAEQFSTRKDETDSQFAEVKAELARLDVKIEAVRSDVMRWVLLVMLGNVALNMAATTLLNKLTHLG